MAEKKKIISIPRLIRYIQYQRDWLRYHDMKEPDSLVISGDIYAEITKSYMNGESYIKFMDLDNCGNIEIIGIDTHIIRGKENYVALGYKLELPDDIFKEDCDGAVS